MYLLAFIRLYLLGMLMTSNPNRRSITTDHWEVSSQQQRRNEDTDNGKRNTPVTPYAYYNLISWNFYPPTPKAANLACSQSSDTITTCANLAPSFCKVPSEIPSNAWRSCNITPGCGNKTRECNFYAGPLVVST